MMIGMREANIDKLDLNLLVFLDVLLETGNLTRAGDRLGLSQPAASRALARLRRDLGAPLFVRDPRGLVPTPQALALKQPLRDALQSLRTALAPQTFDPSTASGAIRLVAPDHEAGTLLPRLIKLVTREAPGLDIELRTRPADPISQLQSGDLDLLIGVFPTAPAGFRRQRLYSDSFVCALRRGHPMLRKSKSLTLEQFVQLPHAFITVTGSGRGAVDQALEKLGKQRRIALRVPQFLAAPRIVAQTDLILTLPRRLAAMMAEQEALVLIDPPLKLAEFQISQLWHERQQSDPRHRWLRDAMVRAADDG